MKRQILAAVLVFVVVALMRGDNKSDTNVWVQITNPELPMTIVNLTTNVVKAGEFVFQPGSTNDMGLVQCREKINVSILQIYNAILSGRLTNIVDGHVAVANF